MKNDSKIMKGTYSSIKKKRLIFYLVGISLPMLQFCIFYLGVNANSILLAFKTYEEIEPGKYSFIFSGFSNFEKIFKDFAEFAYLRRSIVNSIYAFGFTLIGFLSAVFFSYYIFKKFTGGKLFQIFLFLPHIISSIIMFKLYQYFLEECIPAIVSLLTGNAIEGLLSVEGSFNQFLLLNIYGVWAGYGTNVMILCGTMSSVSDSVFDAAKIDGAGYFREFISIVVPIIFPTITTLLIVLIAGIFTNQMSLYTFKGPDGSPNLYTVGYYIYKITKEAGNKTSEFPPIAALGLLVSAVTISITVVARKLLKKVYQ